MQTGQNSIASESSLPQLGQARLSWGLMGPTALQRQSEPKGTPCSTEWWPARPLADCFSVPQTIVCSSFILAGQIRIRNKIPGAGVLWRPRVDNGLKLVVSLGKEAGFTSFRDRRRKTGSFPVSPRGEGVSKGVTRAFISV
jgi:hypothetical protein